MSLPVDLPIKNSGSFYNCAKNHQKVPHFAASKPWSNPPPPCPSWPAPGAAGPTPASAWGGSFTTRGEDSRRKIVGFPAEIRDFPMEMVDLSVEIVDFQIENGKICCKIPI